MTTTDHPTVTQEERPEDGSTAAGDLRSETPAASALDIRHLAEWYASQYECYQKLAREMRAAECRLSEYVRTYGPLATGSGRVEIQPDGYVYDEAGVAEAFPALLKHMILELRFDSVEQAERALSLVCEELPDTKIVRTERAIDKVGAARVERAGGAAGERMKKLRRPKGRLGLTR